MCLWIFGLCTLGFEYGFGICTNVTFQYQYLRSLFFSSKIKKKETTCDYAKAISTIHAGTEVVALQGNRCKSYSEQDVDVSLQEISAMECATGHQDKRHGKVMQEMKSKASVQMSNEDNCWTPFENNLPVWMQWEILVENPTCMNLIPYLVETDTIYGLCMLLLVATSIQTYI